MRRELLLGCGRARDKRIVPPGSAREWGELVTLDVNPAVRPDLIGDLDRHGLTIVRERVRGVAPLPCLMGFGDVEGTCIRDDYFDEVHAYEVLEHLGSPGDHRRLLADFEEIWRVLKPDGYLCATVPSRKSAWLWGDPGHRRVICLETLTFLDQAQYIKQCDAEHPTPMSDYRYCYGGDFEIVESADNARNFYFMLRAVKPSRRPYTAALGAP